jgi:hypothetical protein
MLNGNDQRCRRRSRRYAQLESFDAVVEKLGGARKVGELCENQETSAVCNWKRRRSRFPTKYYIVMKEELEAVNATAPHALWGFYEAKKKR